ncbi:unnamed protein product [Pylaiella littoralis]
MASPGVSPEPAPMSGTMSVKDRARIWQKPAAAAAPPSHSAEDAVPMEDKEKVAPPTFEEIVAMEKAGTPKAKGEACPSPSSGGSSSSGKQEQQQQQQQVQVGAYSRQVNRVSGLGRLTSTVDTPRAAATAAPDAAAAAAAAAEEAAPGTVAPSSHKGRGRSPSPPKKQPQQQQQQGTLSRSQRRGDFQHRRSISVDDPDRRPRQTRSSREQHQTGTRTSGRGPSASTRPINNNNISGDGGGISRRVNKTPGERPPQQGVRFQQQQQQQQGGRGRRAPYTALGTPSANGSSNRITNQQQRQRHTPVRSAFGGGSQEFDITSSPPGPGTTAPGKEGLAPSSTLRRHNSAPDMGFMGEPGDKEEEEEEEKGVKKVSRIHVERSQIVADSSPHGCWGGGLPPTCGQAAARAAMAAEVAAAAGQQPGKRRDSSSSSRYAGYDRESFARTLNEEELDEVWRGLGEGVSQRGHGSEVAFDVGGNNVPVSPTSTAVSGAFPKLTATVLEKHDQLADDSGSGGGSSGGGGALQATNVMPMPKQLGDRTLEDMEAGTASRGSKKSKGSGSTRIGGRPKTTLVGAILPYVVLLLWTAHLLFNVLMLKDVILDNYIWALCLLPGALGIALAFNSCRKSRRHCKPVTDEDEVEDPRRGAPHPCALPAHTLLLVFVVVCLVMHASALLFCQEDMILVFDEATLEPLCGRGSLTLPVILDGVVLSVASLKASSLCWSWVLN